MAVTILRYPGGLEYPEFWKSNVQGLTPTSSYTLSFNEAADKFPGLKYDKGFTGALEQELVRQDPSRWYYNDPTFNKLRQESDELSKKIKTNDPNNYGWIAYNDKSSNRATQEQLSDFARSVELGQQLAKYYNNQLQPPTQTTAPTQTSSSIDIKVVGPETPAPIEEEPSTDIETTEPEATTVSPETEKNLEIVREQAATGNVDSKQFLDSYVADSESVVAQNQGPSTPVKYDEGMKQYVPNPGAGRPGEVRLKNPPAPLAQGPRGESVGEIAAEYPADRWNRDDEVLLRSLQRGEMGRGPNIDKAIQDLLRQKLKGAEAPEMGPRGETVVAQALPSGPRGMDRPPGTYHPSNIMPLITPGSRFSDKEGYMIQDPFKNSPQTGPGLSERESRAVDVAVRTPDEQKASQAFQSEYDPQKARAAASAAKEYKKQSQTEDPFRSSAFG